MKVIGIRMVSHLEYLTRINSADVITGSYEFLYLGTCHCHRIAQHLGFNVYIRKILKPDYRCFHRYSACLSLLELL